MRKTSTNFQDLRGTLLRIESQYELNGEIQNDPYSRVLRYEKAADREVVALIASCFAYGNIKQILSSVDKILCYLGPYPSETLRLHDGAYWKKTLSSNFKHRFNTAYDLGLLLTWMGEALRQFGNLENLFISTESDDVSILLENFIEKLTSLPCAPYKKPSSNGALFFFPRPSAGSGCKRLLLFLRWMIGSGPMALAQWKRVDPRILLIPVDTHILRISRNLNLTKRKDASWKTSVEITSKLEKLSPDDPTRFDFALCHLGISQSCPSRFNKNICHGCEINNFCKHY